MMNKLTGILLMLLTVGVLVGCSSTPDGVLDREDMAQLMADIHMGESVVDANSSTFNTDSSKRALRQTIYARHGLTPAQAEASLQWYGYNMEKYIEVYDRVIEILDERMLEAQSRSGDSGDAAKNDLEMLALEGDSVDIWSGIRFRPFKAGLPSDLMTFVYQREPNWEKGDIYYLRSKMIGNSRVATVTVAIGYEDGTYETMSDRMIGDGWHEIKFGVDTTRFAREIYGTIEYHGPSGETAFIDSIQLFRTRWSSGKPTPRERMNIVRRKISSIAFD